MFGFVLFAAVESLVPSLCECSSEHSDQRINCPHEKYSYTVEAASATMECTDMLVPELVSFSGCRNYGTNINHLLMLNCPFSVLDILVMHFDFSVLSKFVWKYNGRAHSHPGLHEYLFKRLRNLRTLIFQNVIINWIEAKNAFNHLTNLRVLSLRGNQIESFPDDFFAPMVDLRRLNLDKNKLNHVPVNALRPLSNLVYLNLNRNQISHVPDRVFQSKLEHLLLSNNNIATISRLAFACTSSLELLDLRGNPGTSQVTIPRRICTSQSFHRGDFSVVCAPARRLSEVDPRFFEAEVRPTRVHRFWTKSRRSRAVALSFAPANESYCAEIQPMKCRRRDTSPVGTLYFCRNGQASKCAASVVQATGEEFALSGANKMVVLTSPHCLATGGITHTDFLFVGENDWSVRRLYIFKAQPTQEGIGFLFLRASHHVLTTYYPLNFTASLPADVHTETPFFGGASCPLSPTSETAGLIVPFLAVEWINMGSPWVVGNQIFGILAKTVFFQESHAAQFVPSVFDATTKAAYKKLLKTVDNNFPDVCG